MAIVLLSGCSMDNTPTKKVENFLDNYKNQDETVLTQLKDMVDTDSLMDETQKRTVSLHCLLSPLFPLFYGMESGTG